MKIKVENGKITIGRHEVADTVAKLEDGYYNLSIEKWKDSRSIQANNLYWKWLSIIGEYLGYYKEEIHEEMIRMFAPTYTLRGLDGKPRQKKLTTSKMKVDQMAEFMQRVDQFAAEQGIILPRPDDELMDSLIETFDAVEV